MTLRDETLRGAALALILALAVAASYLPVLDAGFIWDDESYVTENVALRSAAGLREIWLSPRATPQYYPLVFTSFWVEHRLWGLRPLGYHATNVALHAGGALLLWRLLAALSVPGAWLAAAIWGLHPVNVESVAWVTERKNVLSAVFYLGALLAIFRPRARPFLGFALFVCALLSKTVTATLPLAVAVLWWWRGVPLDRRRALTLLPHLAAGAAFGGLTVWMEKFHVGAQGADWTLTFGQRLLVAGRALWFYPAKLLWPADLSFVYPRWDVARAPWTHYAYLVAAVAVVAALWAWRSRLGRGPLAAVLFYVLTLAPALGFVDVYPMRFSFVADHFAYLANLGPVVLFAALLHHGLDRVFARLAARPSHGRAPALAPLRLAAAALLLVPLGALTWRQSGVYRDVETLWRDTIRKNPAAWMARNNLGVLLLARGRSAEAVEQYRAALAARPDLPDLRVNLGDALVTEGKLVEAIEQYRRALELQSPLPSANVGLGTAFARLGRVAEARGNFEQALRSRPDDEYVRLQLALLDAVYGNLAAAERRLRDLLRLNPENVKALVSLGDVLETAGRRDEAEAGYREALRQDPDRAGTHNRLGIVLAEGGRREEAAAAFRRAIALDPALAEAHFNLGRLLDEGGRREEAVGHYRRAIAINPASPEARNNLGVDLILLGSAGAGLEQLREAVRLDPASAEARRNLDRFLGEARR